MVGPLSENLVENPGALRQVPAWIQRRRLAGQARAREKRELVGEGSFDRLAAISESLVGDELVDPLDQVSVQVSATLVLGIPV